jgi:5-methylcytosine-specific restriction enzyme A
VFRHLLGLLYAKATGRSPRWRAARRAHLLREPACRACGGKRRLQVHHVYPVSWPHGREVECEPLNLITFCEAPGRNCHLWVGHLGCWKSRNPEARPDAARWLAKIRNRPYPAASVAGTGLRATEAANPPEKDAA